MCVNYLEYLLLLFERELIPEFASNWGSLFDLLGEGVWDNTGGRSPSGFVKEKEGATNLL